MAKGAKVADAIVTVTPTAEGSRKKIEEALIPAADAAGEKAGKSSGSKFGGGMVATAAKALAGAAAVKAIGGAVTGTIKSALDKYASYEQLVGGVETLFKDSADQVKQYADNAFRTAGMSANTYMETVTSFSASLLQGLGGDTKKAAEIADKAIIDMSDNANKMGTDIVMIQNAYQGFAKQNYTMLDNLKLGYGGTASEMARLINDSGVLGDTVKVTAQTVNSVSFDKMIEAIHVVQTNMGITGTTAKEASDTIEGSINTMKGAWENWVTALGREDVDLGEVTNRLIESVGNVAKNVIPRIGQIVGSLKDAVIENLPNAIHDIAGTVSSLLGIEIADNMSAGPIGQILAGFLKPIQEVLPEALKSIQDSFGLLFSTIAEAFAPIFGEGGPLHEMIGSAETAGAAIGNIFGEHIAAKIKLGCELLAKVVEFLQPIITGVGSFVNEVLTRAVPIVQNFFDSLVNGAKDGNSIFDSIGKVLGFVSTKIGEFMEAAAPIVSGVIAGALQGICDLFQAIGEFMSPVIDAFTNEFFRVIEDAKPTLSQIWDNLKNIGDGLFQVFQGIGSALAPLLANAFPALQQFFEFLAPVLGGIATVVMKVFDVVTGIIATIMQLLGPLIKAIGDTLAPILEGICAVIGYLFPYVAEFIQMCIDGVGNVFGVLGDFFNWLSGVPDAVIGFFFDLPDNIVGFFASLPDKFFGLIGDIGKFFEDGFNGIVDFISGIPEQIIDFFLSIPDRISEMLSNIHIPTLHIDGEFNLDPFNFQLPEIGFYANGGIVTKPRLGVVGEGKEPEAIIPLSKLESYIGDIDNNGRGDTNLYVDGAVVNSDEEMEATFLSLMDMLMRKAAMNRG